MSSIPQHIFGQSINTAEIEQQFAKAKAWQQRIKLLVELAKQLPALADDQKNDQSRIFACESKSWLIMELDQENQWQILIDSEAKLVRGLGCILLAAFNQKSSQQIIQFDLANYMQTLGLQKQLSPSRASGLTAIAKAIIERVHSQV